MRVLVCGSRHWSDARPIKRELKKLSPSVVIHGGAAGADTLAAAAAASSGIPVKKFRADWKRYGRGAGPIRNRHMLKEGRPDIVLAFHENIDESKGTKDMIGQAKRAGIKVLVFKK